MVTILYGGQSAQILLPLVLNNIYPINNDLPFLVSYVPCAGVEVE